MAWRRLVWKKVNGNKTMENRVTSVRENQEKYHFQNRENGLRFEKIREFNIESGKKQVVSL